MKTLLPVLASSFLCTVTAIAQPAFNTFVYPENGTHSVDLRSEFTSTAYPYESGGADLVWDFSTYDFGNEEEESSTFYNNVSEGIYSSQFPGANAFERSADGDESYYVTSPTSFLWLGSYIPDFDTKYEFTNPQTIIHTPIAFGQTQNDSYAGTIGNALATSNISGAQTISYDAYGTLILPDQTIENIVRLKMESKDTQFVALGPVMEIVNINTNYSWLLPPSYNSIMTIHIFQLYEDGVLKRTEKEISRTIASDVVTGFSTKENKNLISLFPQPAHDQVFIDTEKLNGACRFSLYNSNGALLKTDEQTAVKGQLLSLALTDVPAGLYVLHIENEGKTYHQKIVIR